MVSQLRQLEVLELLEADDALDMAALRASALSRLPKLRLLNLSGTLLWGSRPSDLSRRWSELRVVQHLMNLQRKFPNIEWVIGALP
jgi:hypothetical protein